MPIELVLVPDWAPSVLLAVAAALVACVYFRMRSERLAFLRRSRDSRVAMLAMVSRLFESAQGGAFSSATRIASLARRTAVALDRPPLEIENLLLAVWLRESMRAYRGMASQGAAAPFAFGRVLGLPAGAIDRALERLEPRIGRDPEDLLLAALPIADAADERWDGGGPRTLDGVRIPAGARILAVVECWDECIEGRPYRPALSAYESAEILARDRSLRFDPAVVHTFLRVVVGGEPANEQSRAA